jgi:hypothetical protein
VDIVVTTPDDSLVTGFEKIASADPGAPLTQLGHPLALFKPPKTSVLDLSGAELSAVGEGGDRRRLDPMAPVFRAQRPCHRSHFLELHLQSPAPVERVEVTLERPIGAPVRAVGGPKEGELEDLPTSEIDFDGHGDLPATEILFFDAGTSMRLLRIFPEWHCSSPWRIRDLKLFTSEGTPSSARSPLEIYSSRDTSARVAR